MSFKEKGLVTIKDVNGKKVEEIQSETVITVTNKITKQEYGSDAEATAYVDDPSNASIYGPTSQRLLVNGPRPMEVNP
mgnify:CR=1 FL=1